MRDPQGYTVTLRKPGNMEPWPELIGPAGTPHAGKTFICGMPGKDFEIVVSGANHLLANAVQQGLFLQTVVHVDGRSVGICRWISLGNPAVYRGFVAPPDAAGAVKQQQFLFGTPRLAGSPPPKATSDREAPKAEDKVGKVTVEIRLMQDTGRRKDIANVTAAGAAPSVRAVDGKKWFNQASLTTAAGQSVGEAVTFTDKEYACVALVSKMECQLETAMTLQLRKVLDYTNPAHAAILKAQMPDMHDEDGAPAEQLPSQAVVKPEAGQQTQQQAASAGCIDLTDDPDPVPKVKKQKF